jgi:serine/threonine protein kinase
MLSHPNIINFKCSWENKEANQIILITEIVSGGTLSQYSALIQTPEEDV